MQDHSIDSSTVLNERADQSSYVKPHVHHVSETISDILYEVSESEIKQL